MKKRLFALLMLASMMATACGGEDAVTEQTGTASAAEAETAEAPTLLDTLPENYDFESHKKLVPMQPGDVPVTYADTSALERDFDFRPNTPLREGIRKFARWYKEFYLS